MKKQYFNPEQDGFYGVYYPNSMSSNQAMIALLGDSSDDHMVKSGAKWLQKRGCNVMATSPAKRTMATMTILWNGSGGPLRS